MSAVAAASGGKDMLPLCKCSRACNFKDGCSACPGQRQTTMAETFSFHIIILTIIIDNIKVYYSLTSPHTVWGLLPEYFFHISHSYPTDHPLLHEIPSMYPHLSGRPLDFGAARQIPRSATSSASQPWGPRCPCPWPRCPAPASR